MKEDLASEGTTDTMIGVELPPGTSLCQGQFTVQHYLNAGGFGITYLAHDSLNRRVVIKECFPSAMCCRAGGALHVRSNSHQIDFERVVALFEREAKALAQLQHPNIVGVHQIFQDNGTSYMAMDYVEGRDLFDVLETDPEAFKPSEVKRILRHLLTALSHVHQHGILHRDISPDNILIAPDGMPVLIDFGAARETAMRQTRILSRIHTVKDGYSPQEFYLEGSTQDQSSDLYALAATTYHLIKGHPPPNSNHRLAAVAQNLADPYEPLAGNAFGYEVCFLAAIDKCLSLFAKDRLKCADDWAQIISGHAPKEANASIVLSEDVQRRISEVVTETTAFIEASQADTTEVEAQENVNVDPQTEREASMRAYWASVSKELEDLRSDIAREQAGKREREEADARVQNDAEAAAEAARRAAAQNLISRLLRRTVQWFAPNKGVVTSSAMQVMKE